MRFNADTKEALLAEVLLTLSGERLVAPDTGSLRGDLVAVTAVADFLRTPPDSRLSTSARAPRTRPRARYSTPSGPTASRAQVIFDRAAARGEIPDASIATLAYEALIGTLTSASWAGEDRSTPTSPKIWWTSSWVGSWGAGK